MKKKIFAALLAVVALTGLIAVPAFAKQDCVDVSMLNLSGGDQYCDDGNGQGVMDILKLIVNVLSVIIGALGIVGIVIVGIQYMSSGGNEEKMRKAKRRMVEIVLGLVAYALVYVLLRFLAPGFNG